MRPTAPPADGDAGWSAHSEAALDYAFTIWDWNVAWTDRRLFETTIRQIAERGFTKVELGVPWASVEVEPGNCQFDEVALRLRYVTEHGLHVRFRVNLQDPPPWFGRDVMRLPDGLPLDKGYGPRPRRIPSLFNDDQLERQHEWARQVAAHFGGDGHEYTLGVGLHFELKYGGWCTYEPSARRKYREWLLSQYGEVGRLNLAWGTAFRSFDEVQPIVPEAVNVAIPVLSPSERCAADWIRFREERLRLVVASLIAAIRVGDPTAVVSVPLGEGFRSASAEFGNQDIYGLSRGADNVVFSYDFFVHGPHELWRMRQLVQTYGDITGLPVKVELDGVDGGTYGRYGDEAMFDFAVEAVRAGAAGINVANYTQRRQWTENLDQFPFMVRLGNYLADIRTGREQIRLRGPIRGLFYFPKWTYYTHRAPTETVHAAHLGFRQLFSDAGIELRAVTDENLLTEDLEGEELLVIPGTAAVDEMVVGRLNSLAERTPVLRDTPTVVVCVPAPGRVNRQPSMTLPGDIPLAESIQRLSSTRLETSVIMHERTGVPFAVLAGETSRDYNGPPSSCEARHRVLEAVDAITNGSMPRVTVDVP